jgi:hypothetical protein
MFRLDIFSDRFISTGGGTRLAALGGRPPCLKCGRAWACGGGGGSPAGTTKAIRGNMRVEGGGSGSGRAGPLLREHCCCCCANAAALRCWLCEVLYRLWGESCHWVNALRLLRQSR